MLSATYGNYHPHVPSHVSGNRELRTGNLEPLQIKQFRRRISQTKLNVSFELFS